MHIVHPLLCSCIFYTVLIDKNSWKIYNYSIAYKNKRKGENLLEKFLNKMSDYFKVDNLDEQSVAFGSRINEETGEIQCRMALVKKNAAGEQYIIFAKDINSDKFYRVYNELSKNGYWSEDELSEKHFTIKFLKENCSGEVLDIIVETAQDVYTNKQSTNQSSQDDLVR